MIRLRRFFLVSFGSLSLSAGPFMMDSAIGDANIDYCTPRACVSISITGHISDSDVAVVKSAIERAKKNSANTSAILAVDSKGGSVSASIELGAHCA